MTIRTVPYRDEGAFPSNCEERGVVQQYGLTKRELLAAMAMQGLLAGTYGTEAMQKTARHLDWNPSRLIADLAVKNADALLNALSSADTSGAKP